MAKRNKAEHLGEHQFESQGEGLSRDTVKYATVGFDTEELKQIEEKAKSEGKSRAKFIRDAALKEIGALIYASKT